jgi:hypothetical protein
MRWTQPDRLDQTGRLVEGSRYIHAGAAGERLFKDGRPTAG